MKKHLRLALFYVSVAAASRAAPFMAVGDGAEIFLTGTVGVRGDDNIFLEKKATKDTIFDVTAGAELTFGKDAQLKGSVGGSVAFATYADNSNLNTTLASADFNTSYDDGKLKLGFNAGYHELNQNAPDIRGLTRRDVFSTGGTGEVEISQITSAGAGVSFSHENYKRVTYGDSDTLTVPVDFYYKWTPKVELSFGYRFRDYQTTIGLDSTDHFFNIGARGEFTPKLTGKIHVGLNTRKLQRGGDQTQPGLDASFNYEITPKTSLQVGASNDYGTSPQGQQQKNFSLNGTVTMKFTDDWSANGGLSYRATNYGSRTDDYWEATLGGAYIVNANIRVVGGYTYRNYVSVLKGSEFENNVLSVAANLRY